MNADGWKHPENEAEAILLALKEPLRRVLLAEYATNSFSPTRLGRRLRIPRHRAIYHSRALVFYGLIELVDTNPARGSTEHFYTVSVRGRRAIEVMDVLSEHATD